MLKLGREIVSSHRALWTLVVVNLKTSVASSRLGWVWWILDPLLLMAIYYFLVGMVLQRGGENYHGFVLSGIVAWQLLSRSVTGGTQSIFKHQALIRQIGMPIATLIAIPSVVQIFFGLMGVLIVMLWFYENIGLVSFGIIPLLVLVAIISYALSLWLAVLEVYARDTSKLVSYALRGGFFLSPVLYSETLVLQSNAVPELAKQIFSMNPMAWIIPAMRGILLEGQWFDWQTYGLILVGALLTIEGGLVWLRSNVNTIVKML